MVFLVDGARWVREGRHFEPAVTVAGLISVPHHSSERKVSQASGVL
jgi:hypothetical protein